MKSALTTPIQNHTGSPSQCKMQEKERKGTEIVKEKINLWLSEDMRLSRETPSRPTKKPPKLRMVLSRHRL